jgi:hypothetical protein
LGIAVNGLADPTQAAVISTAFKRQRLHDAVDLVVVPALGKYQQFRFKLREERRSAWEQHLAGMKLRLLDVGAADFVALDGNRPDGPAELNVLEFLGERDAGRCVLD